MANKFWNGATSTAYGTGGNWVGGVAPVNGDDVYFDRACTYTPAGSDQSGTTLNSGHVGPNFNGANIGSSGSPLILDTNYFSYQNTTCAQAWISLQNGAAAANISVDVFDSYDGSSSPTTRGLHLSCNSTDIFSPCRIRGSTDATVTLDSDCNVTQIDQQGGLLYVLDADGNTTINLIGGVMHYDVAVALTTINVGGGTLYMDDGNTSTVTTLNQWGGTIVWQAANTITTYNGYAGDFDGTSPIGVYTITNTNIWDADMDLRGGLGEPTFTNAPKILGSGSITTDPAATRAVGTLIK